MFCFFFLEIANTAFVKTRKTCYYWDLFREIMKFARKYDEQHNSTWTIIGDEQTYFVMANLRRLLLKFSYSEQSLILGRISKERFHFNFVWFQKDSLCMCVQMFPYPCIVCGSVCASVCVHPCVLLCVCLRECVDICISECIYMFVRVVGDKKVGTCEE